ncbi:single-strand binding protein [Candidatus Koribacter versatilis Ellin345]|uniref:Single-stranded DNA-binding protein n=1 Tax=Koribacter versatilis (strain Ellin345) TaxID=204669 RepID=Q1IPH6_KORVE|nr:single-stranded DNA-binding protein [Candidatus Koribacter versatilis]ABF41224.1 single-strand binding protein [Candidatus Koribacter versatilis Ellin345]
MAKSVNKVILVGNVGKDPEVKYTPQGTAIARFSVATSERFKDKQGEWQDRTEWHSITAWQKLAEIVGEYVKKGNKIYIEGRLRTDSWDDQKTGEKKYRTEIVANDIVLLGGRGGGEGGGEEGGGGFRRKESSSGGGFDQRPSGGNDFDSAPAASTGITDDDIPF